ncbi:hypothetical protein B0T17DRAFT_614402 [Bombardia bombarda]|uniref:Ankyrin n=1 Tax=Bombardia bombarda TaxID=252184 RepID=A0AA39X721_9PEZI|nr:hypothetical protein B0T17DRAFT_614402 [Bombardia bombarda]
MTTTDVRDFAAPAYTEIGASIDPNNPTSSLDNSIDALLARASHLPLPLTKPPTDDPRFWIPLPEDYLLATQLINTFFTAVRAANTGLVTLLISRGFLSPDVANASGQTPLITAVRARSKPMVCALVALGATVDLYGRELRNAPLRTPLMLAAGSGNLTLVKLLIEDFHADDALIAPDGQLALRLAADAWHREVVAYLPARRGGAWRRWRVQHSVAADRVKRAGRGLARFGRFWVWELPRFLVWSVPKHVVVLPVRDGAVYCWENRGRFAGWCRRQVGELPGRVRRGAERVWEGVRGLPGLGRRFGGWVWRGEGWGVVGGVVMGAVSAVHTAVMAVVGFFGEITLRDVWNGVCAVARGVFVDLPRAVWRGLEAFGEVSYKAMKAVFGTLGEVVWWFGEVAVWVVMYVPAQMWEIMCAVGGSFAKGYHEVRVWFDPKH